jgi:hypothetical protein
LLLDLNLVIVSIAVGPTATLYTTVYYFSFASIVIYEVFANLNFFVLPRQLSKVQRHMSIDIFPSISLFP